MKEEVWKEVPKEVCKTWVSLLFRYGTWGLFCAKANMTSPRADKDLFMCWASFNLSPVASDRSTRSLPARSTRCKDPRKVDWVFWSMPHTCMVKMLPQMIYDFRMLTSNALYSLHQLKTGIEKKNLWDRLLRSFNAVAPTDRFEKPNSIRSTTSDVDWTVCMVASGTANPFGWDAFTIPSVCKLRK